MSATRIIIYGAGMMGQLAARFATEKGAEIVAFYRRSPVNPEKLQGHPFAHVPHCTPDIPFGTHKANLVLMTHCSTIADLYEPAAAAARAGLDVLTIAEHAYEPFYDDHELERCRTLDALFREHGKSIVSVGVQDSFWFSQPMAFLSAAQKVKQLIGRCTADLSLFGYADKAPAYIGISPEAFHEGGHHQVAQQRGTFEVALRPLIRALGLQITSLKRENRPVMAEEDISLPQHGIHIRAGTTRGRAEIATFTLSNGTEISGEFHRCYMHTGEQPYNEWLLEGLPTMNMRTDRFQGDAITCASLVNRIPDIRAARPGFLSVADLGPARFYAKV